MVVPFTITETPGIGIPSSAPVTVPDTLNVCAYALSPKEALYIGRGHIGKDQDVNKSVEFRSKDAKKPAKFYLNSATAHQHYKTQWITLDGRKRRSR